MNILLVYLVYFTYFGIKTSISTSPKKHVFFQIDEFIKQLMTSEKFDELADIIAEKAAHKIKNIDSGTTAKNVAKALRQSDKTVSSKSEENNDSKERVRERKSTDKLQDAPRLSKEKDTQSIEELKHDREKKKDKDSRSQEKTHHDREKDTSSKAKFQFDREKKLEKNSQSNERKVQDPEKSRNKERKDVELGKIDTQSFLNNRMTSKELKLNFKHITGALEKTRFNIKGNKHHKQESSAESDQKDHHNKAEKSREETENISTENRIINTKNKYNSVEKHISDGSNEKDVHEQDTFHDEFKNEERNMPASEKNRNSETQRTNDRPIPRNNIEPLDSVHLDNFKFIEESLDEENQENQYRGNKYSTNNLLSVRKFGENDELSHISEELFSTPDVKKIMGREENGKLFVQQTSAEYAEYHDAVVKATKAKFIYKKK